MVFEDVEVHAGPSSCHDIQQDSPLPRDDKGDSPYEDEDDIEFGLGLDDLLPVRHNRSQKRTWLIFE